MWLDDDHFPIAYNQITKHKYLLEDINKIPYKILLQIHHDIWPRSEYLKAEHIQAQIWILAGINKQAKNA